MLNSCRTKLVAASKAPTTVSRTTLRETVSVEFSNVYLSSMSNVISRLPLLGWRVVHRAYHSNSPLGLSATVARRIGRRDNHRARDSRRRAHILMVLVHLVQAPGR